MSIYIDFDGVIIDTWPTIVERYQKEYDSMDILEVNLRKLFKKLNWNEILEKSYKNTKNIEILKKNISKDIKILTKINSEDEGLCKRKFLLDNKINLEMIVVPIDMKKCDAVSAKNNILIDDELKNIREWHNAGGDVILYSKNGDGKDSDGNINIEYDEINNLGDVLI